MPLRASSPPLLLESIDSYGDIVDPHHTIPRILAADLPQDNLYGAVDGAAKGALTLSPLQDARHLSVDSEDMYDNSESYYSSPYTANYHLVNRDQDAARHYSPVSPSSSPVESEPYHEAPINPPMEAYLHPNPRPEDTSYNQSRYPTNIPDYAPQPRPTALEPSAWSPTDPSGAERAVITRYGAGGDMLSPLTESLRAPATHPAYAMAGRSSHPSPPLSDYRLDQSPSEQRTDMQTPVGQTFEQVAGQYTVPHGYEYPTPPHPLSSAHGPHAPIVPISPSSVNAPHSSALSRGHPRSPSSSKTYAFVSLAGNTVKKRPRRRYDEIERLYQCSFVLPGMSPRPWMCLRLIVAV
jgi:hypothetical protein